MDENSLLQHEHWHNTYQVITETNDWLVVIDTETNGDLSVYHSD